MVTVTVVTGKLLVTVRVLSLKTVTVTVMIDI